MTTKTDTQYIKISVSSLVIQQHFNFEDFPFAVHFTLDQTGVLFLGHPLLQVEDDSKRGRSDSTT